MEWERERATWSRTALRAAAERPASPVLEQDARPRPYKLVVPQDIGQLLDRLEWMSYTAPNFKDPSFDEMFPGRDLGVVFFELKEGLGTARRKLGEERHQALIAMADRMRAHFEADADKPEESQAGQVLIREMK